MGTVIRARVIDEHGRPVGGARVYFTSGPGVHPDIAGLTSESGEFALFAPSPGRYIVESAADGFEAARAAVDAPGSGETSVVVRLEPAGGEAR